MTFIREVRPKDWAELVNWFFALSTGFVFRGQRNPTWGLKTTIERADEVEVSDPEEPDSTRVERSNIIGTDGERAMLEDFTSQVHLYAAGCETTLERLAMMQHYGAPTRLLDWTRSPYIATFFAVEENGRGDRAVWALDAHWCRARCREVIAGFRITNPDNQAPDFLGTDPAFRDLVLLGRKKFVVLLDAMRFNQRMAAQQGLFAVPGSIDWSFHDNLQAMEPGDAPPLYKIIIPGKLRPRILHELGLFNIGRRSLFPDMEGFCRSIGFGFAELSGAAQRELAATRKRLGIKRRHR